MFKPCQLRLRASLPTIGIVLAISLCPCSEADQPQLSAGNLILVNGDNFVGKLNPTESANTVCWQSNDFLDPFIFPTSTISTIQFPTESNRKPGGEFVVQCASGDILTGAIILWNADKLVVRSDSLGDVSIRIDEIDHIQRMKVNEASRVLFATGLHDWQQSYGWVENGQDLIAATPNAYLKANVQVSGRLAIDVQLSWLGKPDFVFALGTNPDQDSGSTTDPWRLETVGQLLTAIGEQDLVADVASVADLSRSRILRLTLFLDLEIGQLWLFDSEGQQLASVTTRTRTESDGQTTVADGAHRFNSDGVGIRLTNRGENLKLERLRVWPWTGPLPYQNRDAPMQIQAAAGIFEVGSKVELNLEQQTLELQVGDESSTLELSELLSVQFPRRQQDRTPEQAVFRLRDGTQVSGEINGVGNQDWVLHSDQFVDAVQIPVDEVHFLKLAPDSVEVAEAMGAAPGSNRNGFRVAKIELDESRHLGWIATGNQDTSPEQGANALKGASAIWWQPIASGVACRLKPNVRGRIQYSAIVPSDRTRLPSGSTVTGGQIRRRENADFGKLFLERVERVEAKRARRDQHVIHLVCGDVIACRVESIDETGIYISTLAEEGIQVPHADVRAIELVSKTALPEVSVEKRQRLLTLPRLQKSEPPTHLLFSHDGDLLRCRLIKADYQSIVVEVQAEELVIPSDRITHILWLHPGALTSDTDAGHHYDGMVQTITSDGKRMTFSPTGTTKSAIHGTSRILGECDVDLGKVQQITLGARIAAEATQLAYADWKLKAAMEPLVMQDAQSGEGTGSGSALIGKIAPPIDLERLDGGSFKLSNQLGKIVIVDFWASWCAPCMQTLPSTHQTVAQYDPQKVTFVAINLEERRELVSDAMERLKLNMVVALDTDGITSGTYQATAIPQTVVIDSNGQIADVIIGGGQQAVAKLKQTIDEILNSQ